MSHEVFGEYEWNEPQWRLWATPPEIFRSEMTSVVNYGGTVHGSTFLLRSDFPVLVYFSDKLVAGAGGPYFPPVYRFNYGKQARTHNVVFKLPIGWGGNPAETDVKRIAPVGNLVQSEILKRHGTCLLEAAWTPNQEPQITIPSLLPVHSYQLSTNVLAASRLNPYWTTFLLESVFHINGKLPNELYAFGQSFSLELGSLAPVPSSEGWLYEGYLEKEDVPAGDTYVPLYTLPLVSDGYSGQALFNTYPWVKIPLRSLYKPYAGETPRTRSVAWGHPVLGLLTAIGIHRLYCGYLM